MKVYAVDDMYGNLIASGFTSEKKALSVARRNALSSGESVFVYEVGSAEPSEKIEPPECMGHEPDPERDPQGATVYCDGSCRCLLGAL